MLLFTINGRVVLLLLNTALFKEGCTVGEFELPFERF
jgi:hypothetical protein